MRGDYRSIGAPGPQHPYEGVATFTASVPKMTILRWGLIAMIFAATVGMVATFGALQVRDTRRRDRVDARLATLIGKLSELELASANLTAPPECVLVGQPTIGATFADNLFAIFDALNPANLFQFSLTALSPSAIVTLIVPQASGTLAVQSDIIPVGTTFQDDRFAVRNALDQTKNITFDVGGIATDTTRTLTLQNTSGLVALESQIPTSPNTFFDDVFAVQHAADPSREVMFDVSEVSPLTTQTLTAQPVSGTILLAENIVLVDPPIADDLFAIRSDADASKIAMLDCSDIAPSMDVTLIVPDGDGIIAYIADIPEITEIFIPDTRMFPDLTNEGVETLEELGAIDRFEVSACGGGGAGGSTNSSVVFIGYGGGGGSGAAYQDYQVIRASERFYSLNITIGLGGLGANMEAGQSGGTTSVIGVSKVDDSRARHYEFFLEILAHGGGGGGLTTTEPAYGGAGGSNGGDSPPSSTLGSFPGPAGNLGGFEGGLGGTPSGAPARMGVQNAPWRPGSGGGGGNTAGAGWFGSFSNSGCAACGGSSMFGGPARRGPPISPAAYCAGGSGHFDAPGLDGGDGAVIIRYFNFHSS